MSDQYIASGIEANRYGKGTGKFCGDGQRGPPATGAQPGRAGPWAGRELFHDQPLGKQQDGSLQAGEKAIRSVLWADI